MIYQYDNHKPYIIKTCSKSNQNKQIYIKVESIENFSLHTVNKRIIKSYHKTKERICLTKAYKDLVLNDRSDRTHLADLSQRLYSYSENIYQFYKKSSQVYVNNIYINIEEPEQNNQSIDKSDFEYLKEILIKSVDQITNINSDINIEYRLVIENNLCQYYTKSSKQLSTNSKSHIYLEIFIYKDSNLISKKNIYIDAGLIKNRSYTLETHLSYIEIKQNKKKKKLSKRNKVNGYLLLIFNTSSNSYSTDKENNQSFINLKLLARPDFLYSTDYLNEICQNISIKTPVIFCISSREVDLEKNNTIVLDETFYFDGKQMDLLNYDFIIVKSISNPTYVNNKFTLFTIAKNKATLI
ncbi:MAG: hypothetical protein N3A71_00885 [Candidatus Dojkabacteria bacterium]|nr:hypothetical protein [Candidatus Dojkabacteria bacterium]